MPDRSVQPTPATLEKPALAGFAWVATLLIVASLGVRQVVMFLRFPHKDVEIYYDAAMALRNGEDMFAAFGQAPLTYIYPPLLAIVFLPLTLLELNHAAAVWGVLNVLLLLGCLWLGGRLLIDRFDARTDSATLPVLMLVTTLVFIGRIEAEFDQGQVDFIVLFGVLCALALFRDRPFLAGCLLGIVANIKYQTVVFLPYFVLRGWMRAALGLVSTSILVALSGSLVIGWDLNLDYLARSFSSLGGLFGLPPTDGPMPFIFPVHWSESISLTSVFARWTGGADSDPTFLYLLVGLAAFACFLVGWAIHILAGRQLFRGRSGRSGRVKDRFQPLIAMEWIGLLVAALAFAPQTKMRHLALLLLMVMLMVLFLIAGQKRVRRLPVLLVLLAMSLLLVLPASVSPEANLARKAFRSSGVPMAGILIAFYVMFWSGLTWRDRPDVSDPGAGAVRSDR